MQLLGWVTAHGQVNRLGLKSTQPSILCWMVKWVYQLSGWVIINDDGGCSFLAAYRRANGSSPFAWSKGRQPSGAVLHSSREPGELTQWLWVKSLDVIKCRHCDRVFLTLTIHLSTLRLTLRWCDMTVKGKQRSDDVEHGSAGGRGATVPWCDCAWTRRICLYCVQQCGHRQCCRSA